MNRQTFQSGKRLSPTKWQNYTFILAFLIPVYNFEKHFKFDLELQSEMLG